MQACASRLTYEKTKLPAESNNPEYVLDEDDVKFLRDLQKRDEFLRRLAESAEGMEIVGKVIDIVVTRVKAAPSRA